jgi:hypothetical protein
VLTYGYRTDQSTAIAKEANGSNYAFFPISTFLMPTDLKALFLSDPAVFLNPAEVLLDLGGGHSGNGLGPSLTGRRNKVSSQIIQHRRRLRSLILLRRRAARTQGINSQYNYCLILPRPALGMIVPTQRTLKGSSSLRNSCLLTLVSTR